MASLRKRKYPSGKKAWVVYYRENGKLKIHTIGDVDRASAKKAYHQFCAQLDAEDDAVSKADRQPQNTKRAETNKASALQKSAAVVHRLRELEKEYLDYSRANKSKGTCTLIKAAFWKFYLFSADIPLDQVDFRHVERFKAHRLKTVQPTSINIELRSLRAGFEYAVKIGWLDKNPFKEVKQVPVPEKDYPVYLSLEEIQKLLDTIPDDAFRRLIRFYLLTGCRRTEATKLDWKDVSIPLKTIIIRAGYTKTKKNRVIQMGDKLLGLMKEIGPKPAGKVFYQWEIVTIGHYFRRYCDQCNFGRKITIHSLRHTATVHWLLAGVDMFTISRILGHSSVKVTETVYAHIPAAKKQEVMDKLPY